MDISLKKAPMNEDDSSAEQDVFVFPVSFAQQRLWILDQFNPSNPAYNVFTAYQLTGTLDVKAMEDCLNTILQRHEALRTTFSMQDDLLVQVIAPFKPTTLPVISLDHLAGSEQAAETGLLLEKIARNPFNLSEGPLFQPSLVKLASQNHILVFNIHHIVSDGWSINILWQELSSLYAAYSCGLSNPLPDLPIQYPDYAVWQRELLNGKAMETHLDYWKNTLQKGTSFELPVNKQRPAVFTHQGEDLSFEISSSLSAALKEFSRKENVTLYMTMLAAFKVLLYRYSGQTDIAIATFSANRNRTEIEGLIGFFVNTLVLRTQVQAQASFANLLQIVRHNTLEASAHQDLPFEKLVEELQPIRDLGRNPFVQIAFNYQIITKKGLDLTGLKASLLKTSTRSAKMDLSFGIENRPDGLELTINYYAALFDEDFIQRLAGHYLTLLESILADPHQPIASMPMLTAAERQQMLVDWNETRVERTGNQCLHQLFEKQAALKPDNIALVYEDQQVSYGELEKRSNRLAHHLQSLGLGPEVMAGIFLERSPEMVICVLAVLKAGGVFVPIETSHPATRIKAILDTSLAPIVISRQDLLPGLDGYAGHLVLLDADAEEIDRQTGTPVESGVDPDNLAYVIHTSGTTGVPKGVPIHHRGASNLIQDMCNQLGFGSDDRFLLNFPLSFDVAISQIFLPFTVGGKLIVLESDRHNDSSYLLSLVAKHAITILNTSSSMLENILVEYGLGQYSSLRLVICGAEATSLSLVNRFFKQTSIVLINIYGPTEVSIAVTFWRCQPGGLDGVVPIGRPMANVHLYVLDKNLQPVPIGVPGELYLSGVGLGRGYLGLPGLTAASFIPNPFSIEPGQPMYKTGDRVRYLPDGNIEFLGRVDQQVKIRGFRIELGEVETTLAACPMVLKCALMVREDQPGDKRLVAYVIPNPESKPTSTELRAYLADKLPVYMLPNHFVFMDKIPLTNNGKVNYSLLSAPDQSRPELNDVYQAPVTPTEVGLTAIWEKLLGIERIGIHDNFFELGGHSLLAIRMIGITKKQLGFDLPLSAIFEAPTIHQLGSVLDAESWQPHWISLVAIQPAGERIPLFLVPPSATTGEAFARLANILGNSQPVYSFNHMGLDGRQEPQRSVEDMAALYLSEMLDIQPQGPYLVGGLCFGFRVALEISKQLEEQGQEVALLILFDPGKPFKGHSPAASKTDGRYSIDWFVSRLMRGTIFKKISKSYFKKIRMSQKAHRRSGSIQYTNRCHKEAGKKYLIQPYSGRTILIQTDARKEDLSTKWKKILTGRLDFFNVPHSVHRTFLKKDRNVQIIAVFLNKVLDDFQPGRLGQPHTTLKSEAQIGEKSDG